MIKIPSKQLLKSFLWTGLTFIAPLFIFFIWGVIHEPHFFAYLSLAFLIILAYLFPIRWRISRKKSETSLLLQDLEERINLAETDIRSELINIESYRKKIVNYSQLKGVTEQLGMCLTFEDTSKVLAEDVGGLFGKEDTTIIFYGFNPQTGELGISSSKKGQSNVNLKSKKGDIFDHWVMKSMQPLLVEDTKNDFRFDMEKYTAEEERPFRSLISVPLVINDKPLGIIRLDSPLENCFTTEDLRFLTTIADLGSVAIDNAQLYERVEQLAIRDSLTDLYLRRYLLERMSEEVSRHLRKKDQLSFLMIDLDKFKKYNDQFGHIAGDIVLRTVALVLSETFKQPGDLICRYGGEEFCVLLPECSKNKATELAQQLRQKISEQNIYLRREKTHITVSIGVASYPGDAQDRDELIYKADQAMYRAKNKGRNHVCQA